MVVDFNSISGIYLPLVTPFDQNLDVDFESLNKLCEHYLQTGITGIVPLGSTAEASLLSEEEQQKVLEVIAKHCVEAEVQCMVGVSAASTQKTQENIKRLATINGVTSILSTVPPYIKPNQEGMVQHFEAIGKLAYDIANIPTIAYNIPSRVGVNMSVDTISQISELDYIRGIKQAVGVLDVESIEILAQTKNNDFSFLTGDDAMFLPSLSVGAQGAISATAHLKTEYWVNLYNAYTNGESNNQTGNELTEMFFNLVNLVEASFAQPNPTVFKGVLHRQGLISTPNVRLPLVNASKDVVDRAHNLLSLF